MAGTPTTTSMGDRLLAFIGSFGGQQTVIPVTTIVDSSGNEVTSFGGSGAVTVVDGGDIAQGAKADAAYTTGSGSVVSLLKGIFGRLPALGQAAKAASISVAIASDDDVQAKFGIVTEAAPASDTASSGLNGRLQRIAQRLTSLIALVPSSLGRKASSTSLAVAVAAVPYATVAASQINAVFGGGSGAVGDFLSHIVIQPATTAAGTVTILDNAVTVFTFTTGTLSDLRPITVPIGAFSVSGVWKCTTGANVSVTGFGNFT